MLSNELWTRYIHEFKLNCNCFSEFKISQLCCLPYIKIKAQFSQNVCPCVSKLLPLCERPKKYSHKINGNLNLIKYVVMNPITYLMIQESS